MEESVERKEVVIAENKTWSLFGGELNKVSRIAAPMVAVSMLQYLVQVVTVIMVGHLHDDPIALPSVAIATSLTNVTGFSLLSGLVGGLETLCGQAYGARQYKKVGVYTCTSIVSLLLVCPPICIIWIFLDKLLILIRQNPLISLEARRFAVWLIPALFGGAILKPLVRYLQSQNLTLPLLFSSFLALCVHIFLSWIFIFKLKMSVVGAAIASSLSNISNVIMIVLYTRFSPSFEYTRLHFSKEAFYHIKEYFGFAIPAALMVCLKWWSVEVLVLVSGLLPNPRIETSVLSICLTISALHFTIPLGLGAAASTRVSNELGAGKPQAARMAVWAIMFLAISETIVVSIALFSFRHVLGHTYSQEKQIVEYVAMMTPFICLSIITDSLQAVISGIARGSGWQHIGAYVNLMAFYLFGIPASIVLGFVIHLNARGLWIGIVIGSVIQSTILSLITIFTNWKKQANNALERLSAGTNTTTEDNI